MGRGILGVSSFMRILIEYHVLLNPFHRSGRGVGGVCGGFCPFPP
jgi:hypothetical protein